MMSPEAKKAKNAYQAAWRRKNPDKVKANTERHWEKVAAAAMCVNRKTQKRRID